jgi:glycosyltransferase involved in cell wall biosynthesis
LVKTSIEMKPPHDAHLAPRMTTEPVDRPTPHRWNSNSRRSATGLDDEVTRVTLTFTPVAEPLPSTPRPVLSVGLVPPGASGVRDYGRLLAAALRCRGGHVDELWLENAGVRLRPSFVTSVRLLRLCRQVPRGGKVLWHYSSFAYCLRGVPLPGVLLGLTLRARGARVLTVLHEPAYPWGRRGLHGRVQAVTQSLALPLVLMGSTAVVVTTERRALGLRRAPWPFGSRVIMAPVFSTVEVAPPGGRRPKESFAVGVLGYTGDGARPDLIFAAMAELRPRIDIRAVLLGAPGPTSPEGQRCQALAAEAGVADRVEFTGVVPTEELSRRLQDCDVVLLVNEEGPSSRRTTLAITLAHGMPLVCVDGPDRWEALVADDAAVLVPAEADALSSAVERLLVDPSERRRLGERARHCYERRMALESVAATIAGALEAL